MHNPGTNNGEFRFLIQSLGIASQICLGGDTSLRMDTYISTLLSIAAKVAVDFQYRREEVGSR